MFEETIIKEQCVKKQANDFESIYIFICYTTKCHF